MKIISMIEYRCRETIAVLRYVLKLTLRGEINGVALCFRVNGRDEFALTGEFKTDSAAALKAAHRISWKMNQAMDSVESPFH